jgi:hypothetical protein
MKIEAMLWILVLVSVAIAIVSTKHRTYSLIAAGGIILAIVAIVVLTDQRKPPPSALPTVTAPPAAPAAAKRVDFEKFHIENLDKVDPEARNRIPIKEIRFEQIRSQVGPGAGTIESIRARLYNDSTRYALTDYAYYLAVQDCASAVCTIIYEQRGQTAAAVPAGQARDIVITLRDEDTLGIPNFKVLGTASITLTATETRAYLTGS